MTLNSYKERLELVQIGAIKPYKDNPRQNKAAIGAIKKSIQRFGLQSFPVIDASNTLVIGHTRLEALRALGYEEIPCLRVTNLTESEINAYRILDNKLGELAEWDATLLEQELVKLQNADGTYSDIPEIHDAFSQEELDKILKKASEPEEPPEQEPFPRENEPVTLTVTKAQWVILQQAIAKLREVVAEQQGPSEISDGRALELIAADFIAG